MHLLTVGEAFEDVIFGGLSKMPRLGEEIRVPTFARQPGGGAILTAIAAARLGLDVAVLTATNADNDARVRAEGVAVRSLTRMGEVGAVTAALSTPRDRAFVTFEGVNRVLEPRLRAGVDALDVIPSHVHFALSPRRCAPWIGVVRRIKARGAVTSWDFGWNRSLVDDRGFARLLAALDWVFVNEAEARLYGRTRSLAAAVTRWPTIATRTIVKLGPRGAIALGPDGSVRATAPRTRVVDTTGAGDAFNGGVITGLLSGLALADALRLATWVGSQSTRALGGVAGLPRRADLPAWARRALEAPAPS